jgi:hypothetical protein
LENRLTEIAQRTGHVVVVHFGRIAGEAVFVQTGVQAFFFGFDLYDLCVISREVEINDSLKTPLTMT